MAQNQPRRDTTKIDRGSVRARPGARTGRHAAFIIVRGILIHNAPSARTARSPRPLPRDRPTDGPRPKTGTRDPGG